jgi:hypothetical protein
MTPTKQAFPAKIEKTRYNGWEVYRLTNGIVSLYVAPQLGGRAIQMELDDQGYFFVNKDLAGKVLPEAQNNLKAGWGNYGGDKVWPAPEGWMNDHEWPSVPYYVLDGSDFHSEILSEGPGEVAIRVTSPEDLRTGVQFIRTYHLYAGTTRIKVDQTMRNISRRQIRWGIWHLVQNDAADASDPSKPNPELYMYIPLNPHSKFPQGYYQMLGEAGHPSYKVLHGGKMLRAHFLYRVGKIGVDSNAGWYAVVNGQKNIAYVETFKYFPELSYPDGASVETWNDGPGTVCRGPWDQTLADDPKQTPYFFEAETVSPYAQLDPGEEYSFPVGWAPTRVTNPIRDFRWSGAISESLSGKLQGDSVQLKGVFGVFEPGTLEAVFYSALGEELARTSLQAADPREVVRLDKTLAAPQEAFRVGVRLRDGQKNDLGALGNVILRPRR